MPKKKKSEYQRRSEAIKRRYKQYDSKGWKKPRYFGRDKTGMVPRDKKDKPSQLQGAISRHYKEYVTKRPVKPRADIASDKLGPELMFSIGIRPDVEVYFNAGNRSLKIIYESMIRDFRLLYRKIGSWVQTELIGDPRTFGTSGKGLVPRGGTGYARMLTRGYIVSQYLKNTRFPYEMNLSIPVEYARYINYASVKLKHTSKERRIVDYIGKKPVYSNIKLYDPSAENKFFERIIDLTRKKAADEAKRLIHRLGGMYNAKIAKVASLHTFPNNPIFKIPMSIVEDIFVFGPSDFARHI
jgi:hypothetical protein